MVLIDPDAEPRRPRPLRELLRTGPRPRCPTPARTPPSTTSRGPAAASNHYLFDLNRDWIGAHPAGDPQPGEGAARVAAAGLCGPARDGRGLHLFLHARERPVQSAPDAESARPASPSSARTMPGGSTNTVSITSRAKQYDAFYPGYGASWPFYYGALSMTYEQASVRGLVVRRSDETLLTFRDTVRHHFVASISTLETAAVNREKLLDDFYQYRVTRHRGRPEGAGQGVHSAARPRCRRHRQTGRHPDGARHRSQPRQGGVQGRRQGIRRGHLRGADGAALQAFHPHPARPARPRWTTSSSPPRKRGAS